MAMYDYHCSACGERFEKNVPIADRDKPLEEACPACAVVGNVTRGLAAPATSYTAQTKHSPRVPDGFKDVLRRIHEKSPGSQLKRQSTLVSL